MAEKTERRKVAKIAKLGFGMKVAGYDIVKGSNMENFDDFCPDFAEAVKNADFVTIHIPNIPATQNFINSERLSMMKKGCWLINTARGGVVDEDALFDAVKDNLIGGAALDVFKNEPYIPQMKDLRTLENVIMTPHIGSSTLEACERMALSSLKNIASADAGKITEMNII